MNPIVVNRIRNMMEILEGVDTIPQAAESYMHQYGDNDSVTTVVTAYAVHRMMERAQWGRITESYRFGLLSFVMEDIDAQVRPIVTREKVSSYYQITTNTAWDIIDAVREMMTALEMVQG